MTRPLYLSCGHAVMGTIAEGEYLVCPKCHNLVYVTVSKCEYFDGCIVKATECESCKDSFYCPTQSRIVTTHCNFKLCTEKPNVAI